MHRLILVYTNVIYEAIPQQLDNTFLMYVHNESLLLEIIRKGGKWMSGALRHKANEISEG
jgi:hypothetical protein